MTNITQEDWDAAKCLVGLPADPSAWNDDNAVQAFSRHREAAEAKERERIVAWLRAPIVGGDSFESVSDVHHDIAASIEAGEHREANDATSE